ncbi:diguanylate cyclase DgcJ [Klebsiella sp. I138]|uniref:diguanylate cyclase DgcJ n=1 Tax=Klebsiella sp. I138 TaxID=2755385 RepID=UPI003DA96626
MRYSSGLVSKYINAPAIIILLTTVIFTGIFVHEYRSLQASIESISENGKSALFQEEYINQVVASQLSRGFSAMKSSPLTVSDVCRYQEKINGVIGLNLSHKSFPDLVGTLQARDTTCAHWASDIPALILIQDDLSGTRPKYSFSNYASYRFNNTRYYIDIVNDYVYINHLVDSHQFVFNNWLIKENGRIAIYAGEHTIKIDSEALYDLYHGESIVSHVYLGRYTKKNIISLLTPVFKNGEIKGVLVSDFTINDLTASFYTHDRPLLWQFLSLYITDNSTGDSISFHTPSISTFSPIKYRERMTNYYTLHIQLDAVYLVISTLWLLILYVISTWSLCRYAQQQIKKHLSISLENVTDTMTTLYNRKILTPALDKRIKKIMAKNIPVTAIAIDSDGLKKINDNYGHAVGDEVISILGQSIAQSIRKNDYGIRLGGDEFSLILIGYDLGKSAELIERINQRVKIRDTRGIIQFSSGCYQLTATDSVEEAFRKADALLYRQKCTKYGVSHQGYGSEAP